MICGRGAQAAAVPRTDAFILGNVCSVLLVQHSIAGKTYTWAILRVLHSRISLPAKTASVGTDGQEVTSLGVAAGEADIPAFRSLQGGYYPPRSSAVQSICLGSV